MPCCPAPCRGWPPGPCWRNHSSRTYRLWRPPFAGARGITVGDVDNDGWPDLFVTGDGGHASLLLDEAGTRWSDPAAAGDRSARSGVGARVDLHTVGAVSTRQITAASTGRQGESLAHSGLGTDGSPERLVVHWPSGQTDAIASPPIDATIYVYEGRTIYNYFPRAPSS
ncbi:MAG: CRTAC1 family protein [Candidatus Latescibacterota bacterium]|nr:CRTAC1 family protein [Candidatus Latescibacterota bacterium]